MSDLSWLDRIETRRREWGGGFFLADAEVDFVLAAARAHLEGQECVCAPFWPHGQACPVHNPQPPQQREDDDGRSGLDAIQNVERDNRAANDIGDMRSVPVVPASSSTDAGLVERLELWSKLGPGEQREVVQAVRSALKEKDALVERLRGYMREYEDAIKAKDAQEQEIFQKYLDANEALIEAQAEIERLREALKPFAAAADYAPEHLKDDAIEISISACRHARAALKGGDG
jgi:hypothetical protein